jgi:hypothetical protein
VTKSLRPHLEVPGPLLALFLLLVLFAATLRPRCPAAQSGWFDERTPVACHVQEDGGLVRLARQRGEAERAGDLALAVSLQRRRVAWYERGTCHFDCDYHHDQHRIDELAELGRLARLRNAQRFER